LRRTRLEREVKQKGTGAVRCDKFEGREARWLGKQAHSSDRLWEMGSTEEGMRTFFLRTIIVG
jgi:hypothetical protein